MNKLLMLISIALLSQIACFEIIQAGAAGKSHKKVKVKKRNKPGAKPGASQGAKVAGAAVYSNNNQQQQNFQDLLDYCINNPNDSRCVDNTPSTTPPVNVTITTS